MNTNIQDIHQSFINEAKAAPTLFSDLAKIELYIAESYRTRAFIELLQNADDANAKRFLIQLHGDKLIVANDGRVFTLEDIESLCRSGASNKQRGSGTIGYRGIGFKSVAGIASEIDIISGDYYFQFSKLLTKNELNINQDTPLIRIPHNLNALNESVLIAKQLINQDNFSTVFIMSGLNLRILTDEANAFEESALIFLNSIQQVKISLPEISKSFIRSAIKRADGYTVETIGDKENNTWLVAGLADGCEKIAFRIIDDMIVPAEKEKSVIHAFMPTTEFAGAFFKMNGDFSTDPSRKGVDMDNLSENTFKRCTQLLAELIVRALTHNELAGIFSTFVTSSVPVELGRFRKFLREALLSYFEKNGLCLAGFKTVNFADIRLAPEWLTYEDYEKLCQGLPHITHELLSSHPEVQAFFKWLGAKTLSNEDALTLSKVDYLSMRGYVQVIEKFARQNRFDMTEERLALFKASRILPLQDNSITVEHYTKGELHPEALCLLEQSTEIDNIRFLFRRIGLEPLLGVVEKRKDTIPINQTKNTLTTELAESTQSINSIFKVEPEINQTKNTLTAELAESTQPINSIFKVEPAIKQWRSAEQNTLAWFSALKVVSSAKDVSKANVGYDLEILLNDGKRFYIEVKSVKRLGDSIRMTNNEYSTAHQYGKNYLLVMVVNSDPLEIKIIPDPVRTLPLDKRCEQWSWYCENYLDESIDFLTITEKQ